MLGLLLAVGLVLGGCSEDGGSPSPAESSAPEAESTSSPFRVEAPHGLEPAGEGRGTYRQLWGDDSFGNHGPFVVLAPDTDSVGPDDLTVVTASGFESYQGGLEQASATYTQPHQELELRGRPALFSDAGPPPAQPFSELLVERGDDLALVIRSPGSSLDDLIAVDEATSVAEDPEVHRRDAPLFEGIPGLEVVGSADADLAMALDDFYQRPGEPPGPPSSYGLFFESPGDGASGIAMMTVPSDRGDVRATLGFVPGVPEIVDVAGREAVLSYSAHSISHLVTTTAWGDLLVIRARTDPADSVAISREALIALAESVEQVDG